MTNQLLENEKLGALTLEDLVFFVTLCEELSLSETAKRCSLSLSGASRTMKKLREVFDDKLFLRSMPDSIATERALELYPLVSDIVERAGALTHSAVFDPVKLTKTFRIGAVDNALFAVMPEVVKAFFKEAPHARLEVAQVGSNLLAELENGHLDCAVFPSTLTLPHGYGSLRFYPVKYALCVREGHPLQALYEEKGKVTTDDIAKYRKVRISNESASQTSFYSLDERTYLGEAVQDCAVVVPYFLSVPTILQETDFTATLPMQTALRMQQTIKSPSKVITHSGVTVVLVKNRPYNNWLLSGYRNETTGDTVPAFDVHGATDSRPTPGRTRGGAVADSYETILGATVLTVKRSEDGSIQGVFDPASGKSYLIVVIPAEVPLDNTKGREFFYTQLIWHERVARDPAMQWFRGLFAAYATAQQE